VCGAFRTTWLPHISDDLHEQFDDSVVRLCEKLVGHLTEGDVVGVLSSILAAHIVVLEARLSRKPEISEDPGVLLLHRNLFRVVLLFLSRSAAPAECQECGLLTDIVSVIVSLLLSDGRSIKSSMPLLDFIEAVHGLLILREVSSEQLLSVLRRATLFGHFMMGCCLGNDSVIDWDAVLDARSLFGMYGFPFAAATDVPFLSTIPLARDWVLLSEEPYNYDIVNWDLPTGLDLITGDLISVDITRPATGLPSLPEHAWDRWDGAPVLVLDLTGPNATSVGYVTVQFGGTLEASSCYLDKQRLPDVGFQRGMYLELDAERLNELMDALLSGRFCSSILV
jgi:hypothetical protein